MKISQRRRSNLLAVARLRDREGERCFELGTGSSSGGDTPRLTDDPVGVSSPDTRAPERIRLKKVPTCDAAAFHAMVGNGNGRRVAGSRYRSIDSMWRFRCYELKVSENGYAVRWRRKRRTVDSN
jgi:hypothetical protein